MTRKNRSPEENARRAKIRELLLSSNISSMDDIQDLFKETIAEFMESGLEAELDDELGYGRYGVSVRRVEDITEALWGCKVSSSTISELNKKAYEHIEQWRNRPLQGGKYPYVRRHSIFLRTRQCKRLRVHRLRRPRSADRRPYRSLRAFPSACAFHSLSSLTKTPIPWQKKPSLSSNYI